MSWSTFRYVQCSSQKCWNVLCSNWKKLPKKNNLKALPFYTLNTKVILETLLIFSNVIIIFLNLKAFRLSKHLLKNINLFLKSAQGECNAFNWKIWNCNIMLKLCKGKKLILKILKCLYSFDTHEIFFIQVF